MKRVFKHQHRQMFHLKLNKYELFLDSETLLQVGENLNKIT